MLEWSVGGCKFKGKGGKWEGEPASSYQCSPHACWSRRQAAKGLLWTDREE